MAAVARAEGKEPEEIRELIAQGRAVIAHNRLRKSGHPLGIGAGLSVKVNANIGTSQDLCNLRLELKKLESRGAGRRGRHHGPVHRREHQRHPPENNPRDPARDRHRADLSGGH